MPLPDELTIAPDRHHPVVGKVHDTTRRVHDLQGEMIGRLDAHLLKRYTHDLPTDPIPVAQLEAAPSE